MAKKKILLLSDDLRMSSGVATMSREFVLGTVQRYDWIQIGGAIKHPDEGKVFDVSKDIANETGVKDAMVKVYPSNGYGSEQLLREVMGIEQPDALLIYTDPRFWIWLFQMEHEIRRNIPIFYYNIWDDLPYPMYNKNYYDSVDLLMNISRQTVNIVKNVRSKDITEDWQITYIPHGIVENIWYPITEDSEENTKLTDFKNELFDNDIPEFTLLYNNRNIRRKMPGDIILAYKTFCDGIPKEQAEKCALVMHTQPVDNNGTHLPAVVEAICPDYRVVFSTKRLTPQEMNYFYNAGDVTINIASNEGFGLGTCESLMSGTPIIVNVTGGLQDQCGFKKSTLNDGEVVGWEYLTVDDYTTEWGSNHDGKYKDHGEWVIPVYPSSRALVGSVPTPYIFDDRCRWEDAAVAIRQWYDLGDNERKRRGLLGREFITDPNIGMASSEMCRRFINDMDTAFENWKPRKRFKVYKV